MGLTQTVACLVRQQLDEVVGQEKMSSDAKPGDESGNQCAAASAALHVSTVDDEQGQLIGRPEVGDYYSVAIIILLQNAGPQTTGRRSR